MTQTSMQVVAKINVVKKNQGYFVKSVKCIILSQISQISQDVHQINHEIQSKIPGESYYYNSIDTVLAANKAVQYRIEFLNSLNPSGMPQHKLI